MGVSLSDRGARFGGQLCRKNLNATQLPMTAEGQADCEKASRQQQRHQQKQQQQRHQQHQHAHRGVARCKALPHLR